MFGQYIRQGRGFKFFRKDQTFEGNKLFVIWVLNLVFADS